MKFFVDINILPAGDDDYEYVEVDLWEGESRSHVGSVKKMSHRSVDGRGDKDTIVEAISELLR